MLIAGHGVGHAPPDHGAGGAGRQSLPRVQRMVLCPFLSCPGRSGVCRRWLATSPPGEGIHRLKKRKKKLKEKGDDSGGAGEETVKPPGHGVLFFFISSLEELK